MRFGKVRFSLKGRNVERFVNQSIKKGISILSIDKKDNSVDVEVDYKEYKRFKRLAKSFEIENEEYYGFCRWYKYLLESLGVIVGIILASIMFFYAESRVWRIEILGLERIERQSVVDILDEMNYNIGSSVFKVDNKLIEDRLLEKFEDLSMVSVMHEGCSIVISVKEKEYEEELDTSLVVPVVAKADGIVQSIVVTQGTPMVKVGDIVRKGDVLIAPFVVDKEGNTVKMRAIGSVKAVVYAKGSVTYQNGQEKLVRSGNSVVRKNLSLFGVSFPSHVKVEYEYYDTEITTKPMCKNFLLPFEVSTERCYELIKVKGGDFASEKDVLVKESIYKAYETLEADFDVQSEQTDIVEVAGAYFVTTYLKVLTDIA